MYALRVLKRVCSVS